MDKKMLKQVKSDYEDLEIKPSADLWDKIEGGLYPKQESSKSNSKKEYWLVAAAFVLMLSLGLFSYKKNIQNSKLLPEKIQIANQKDISTKPVEAVKIKKENLPETVASANRNIIRKKVTKDNVKTAPIFTEEVEKIVEIVPQNNVIPDEKKTDDLAIVASQLFVSEPTKKDSKIKYVTASDLIFQNKYKTEKVDIKNDGGRRLGVIKINKIHLSPELITIFNSSTNE